MSEPKAIARAMIDSWVANDLEKARTLIAENSSAWLAHTFGVSSGANKGTMFPLSRWLELLQEAIDRMPKGLGMVIHKMVAEDNWVVVELESHGYLEDGRLYNVPYTFWFDVRDGKIRELRQYFDTKYALSFFLDFMTRA